MFNALISSSVYGNGLIPARTFEFIVFNVVFPSEKSGFPNKNADSNSLGVSILKIVEGRST